MILTTIDFVFAEKDMRTHYARLGDGAASKRTSPSRVMGKKSSRRHHLTEHHFLNHVDRVGLEEIRESLIAEGKTPVRMNTPLDESIESVYDGVHDGRVLGTGVSGLVRRVTHKVTGEEFAVKIIDLNKYGTERRMIQLKNEIRISARVDHPNIIRLEEVFQSDSTLYLVQEMCNGGDLFDLLHSQKNRRLEEDDARRLVQQILSAIKYLHAHNILHRDVKLENFLLTTTDFKTAELRMIDFGVAKTFIPGQVHRETVGTPYSLAPDVLRRCHSERSDVWSCGVLAFALLSGKTPFGGCDGGNIQAVRNNILKGEFSFQGEAWASVSDAAKDFVMKLLTVDMYRRPSSRAALRHEWMKQRPTTVVDEPLTTKAPLMSHAPVMRVPSLHSARIQPVLSM